LALGESLISVGVGAGPTITRWPILIAFDRSCPADRKIRSGSGIAVHGLARAGWSVEI
jgi:hypothetical protein